MHPSKIARTQIDGVAEETTIAVNDGRPGEMKPASANDCDMISECDIADVNGDARWELVLCFFMF